MVDFSIKGIERFCDRLILFEERGQKLRDGRKAPQIPAWLIFKTIFYNAIFGGKSLLEADQLGRDKGFVRFVGSSRFQVASDTTMHTSLGTMCKGLLEEWMRVIYQKAKQEGLLKVKSPQLGGLRLGAIDGTGFGKFLASCFQIVAEPSMFIDFERIPKRGKELPSSHKLIRKLAKRFGKGFIDLLLLDGLYISQEYIEECVKVAKIDVLIKLKEEEVNSLNILKDAEGIFSANPLPKGVEYVSDIDQERMVEFEVWAAEGFYHNKCDIPLKVAKVVQRHLKNGQESTFWVVTTLQTLTANQLRIGGHIRWNIENNGFKSLNRQTGSKHIWTHDASEWEALTRILLMAFGILELFISQLDFEKIRQKYGGVSTTMHFICSQLAKSLIAVYSIPAIALI